MLIQEKELNVYAKTNFIEKVSATRSENNIKPLWQLEFKIKGESEIALLITTLNKPRLFPNVDYLIEYVNIWCPKIEQIVFNIKKNE
ncbi:MAG: hypothetical protein HRT38_04510 [Alteromonadaceae bacterium]|nr:hypothetical protein [Alteromonadaceae bacterium]